MSPEFGATSTLFPIDDETLSYLRLTGRSPERVDLVERYARTQGLWREPGDGPTFDELLELDLASIEPSVAGPRRPQDRVPLTDLRDNFRTNFPHGLDAPIGTLPADAPVPGDGAVEDASAASFPASDPTSFAAADHEGTPPADPIVVDAPPVDGGAYRPIAVEVGGQADDHPDRLGGDRRDHLVHEHVQPDRDGRRRPARPERGRARPARRAGGQDLAGPRLARGDRLPRGRRADGAARDARLRAGRLRLHDLHRQLRAARRRGRRGGRGQRSRRRRRPVGQPQLRGPDPPARPSELPRLTSARGRLRPRRPGRHRPHDRTARDRQRRPAGLPRRHLAGARRDPLGHRRRDRSGALHPDLCDRLRGRRSLARAADPGRRPLRLGGRLDVYRQATVLRRSRVRTWARRATSSTPACSPSSATRSRPITSRRPARSRRGRPPASGSRRTASVRSSSTRMARGAATTR